MIRVRPLEASDWPAVEAIFADAIAGGEASFETSTPTWEEFDSHRIPGLRLVAVDDDEVVGWAAAAPASPRPVLAGVVEHAIYLARDVRGRRIGTHLLGSLVQAVDDAGYWTMQSNVFPENAPSLALHARFGFRVVGRRERIARSTFGPNAGRWRDSLLIERRSLVNGR